MRWLLPALLLFGSPASPAEWRSDLLCDGGTLTRDVRLQLQRGTVRCTVIDGRPALRFDAGARTRTVGKAALIVPFDPRGTGSTVTVEAEVFLPADTPANSIILIDIECKRCGLPGNPGLRLYLREGGFRIDRKKIGEKHAWAERDPVRIVPDTWVRIRWDLELGDADTGRSIVAMDGAPVLRNRGRTLPPAGADSAVDRVQIGLTANSNAHPATLLMRDIRIRVE